MRSYVLIGYVLYVERDSVVMLVARNIESAMQRRGSNPSDLAKKSGKSRSPRLDTLHKIAVGLEMPFSALFVDPVDDDLDQALIEALGQMPAGERRRFLVMARALLSQPAIAG